MFRLPIATASIIAAPFPSPAIAVAFHFGETGRADCRWPMVARTLAALRRRGRRSVRIVDAACGAGDLLLRAVRRARELGFVAIEARGVDRRAGSIACARSAARRLHDPAIGLAFDVGEPCAALEDERELPADIVLYDGGDPATDAVAKAAGIVTVRSQMPARLPA